MGIMNSCAECTGFQEQAVYQVKYLFQILHKPLRISGRHCCLWCLIKQGQLCSPPVVRGPATSRTVQSICADHQQFISAGSILKNVKNFSNCLNEPFFRNFPLSQVSFRCSIDRQIIMLDLNIPKLLVQVAVDHLLLLVLVNLCT